MKYLAEFLSLALHPVIFFLIMPFLIVYRYTENQMSAIKWELFSAFFVILAVGFVFFEKRRGVFSDYDLSKKEERYAFYRFLLIFGIIYIGVSLFFKGILFPMSLIALGIVVGLLIIEIVNRYKKASVHICVACAFATTMGLLYDVTFFLATFFIISILTWSRLVLKKHTISEIFTGGLLGVLITLLTFIVGRYMSK